jgi:hypothetical protein
MSSFASMSGGGASVELFGLCCVCQESYEPDGERAPLIVPCGHTYCFLCLKTFPTKECPVDHQQYESAEKLPKNFALIRLIDSINSKVYIEFFLHFH